VYGSYTAAGLKNVWAMENFFHGTDIGFRFKTGTGHGGGIGPLGPNDVGFIGQDNIGKVGNCMVVTDEYGDTTGLPRAGMGEFRDITLTNYTCSGSYNLDTGTNIVVNGKKLR
jgi:polygalacturonase